MKKLILQITHCLLFRTVLRLFIGVQIQKANSLERDSQYIIVANHNSHLDTISLMASIPSNLIHKVKPVAAVDHFGKNKWVRFFCNYFINTLLIPRKRNHDNPNADPINKMIKALDDGYSLILFPEGTRGEPEVKQRFKAGIALLLQARPHVKYIPAYMKGMAKVLPKNEALVVPFNCTLKYGKAKNVVNKSIDDILELIRYDFHALKMIS